jgi:cytochrome c-type biogenesis protein CcmH/NrfF
MRRLSRPLAQSNLGALRRLMLAAGLGAMAAVVASAAQAQAPASAPASAEGGLPLRNASERSQRIADELRSPFCPGKTLLNCTSGQAFTARQEIRDRLMAGESEAAIIDDFRARYGENITNPPQPWYAAVGPFVPAIVGVLVLAVITWRWRKSRAGEAPASPVEAAAASPDADRLARLRRQVATEED